MGVEVFGDQLVEVDVRRVPATVVDTAVEPVLGTVGLVWVGVAPTASSVIHLEQAIRITAAGRCLG